MKFIVEQSALVDGVNWVSRSLSTRPIKTELLGIVIDATGDQVYLSASDLETASKSHFQAEDGIRDFCLSRGLGDVYKRQFNSWTV